jgi:hypothetical protein
MKVTCPVFARQRATAERFADFDEYPRVWAEGVTPKLQGQDSQPDFQTTAELIECGERRKFPMPILSPLQNTIQATAR